MGDVGPFVAGLHARLSTLDLDGARSGAFAVEGHTVTGLCGVSRGFQDSIQHNTILTLYYQTQYIFYIDIMNSN